MWRPQSARGCDRTTTVDKRGPQRPIERVGEHFSIILPFTSPLDVVIGKFLCLLAQYALYGSVGIL